MSNVHLSSSDRQLIIGAVHAATAAHPTSPDGALAGRAGQRDDAPASRLFGRLPAPVAADCTPLPEGGARQVAWIRRDGDGSMMNSGGPPQPAAAAAGMLPRRGRGRPLGKSRAAALQFLDLWPTIRRLQPAGRPLTSREVHATAAAYGIKLGASLASCIARRLNLKMKPDYAPPSQGTRAEAAPRPPRIRHAPSPAMEPPVFAERLRPRPMTSEQTLQSIRDWLEFHISEGNLATLEGAHEALKDDGVFVPLDAFDKFLKEIGHPLPTALDYEVAYLERHSDIIEDILRTETIRNVAQLRKTLDARGRVGSEMALSALVERKGWRFAPTAGNDATGEAAAAI